MAPFLSAVSQAMGIGFIENLYDAQKESELKKQIRDSFRQASILYAEIKRINTAKNITWDRSKEKQDKFPIYCPHAN